ncbi:hypothetical protein [Paraburkholderia terrae]|uniref:hypothetical protein n=1 Tax=Paraburkholderia terrae TaxID=311230 RepID=UPI000AA0B980|nr:hypothetical protein [Paraburkholderia terrae]
MDRIAFVGRTTMQPSATMPDWNRNARVPWARDVIIGLAGRFSENAACADTAALLHESAQRVQLARITLPVHVIGRASPMAPGSRRSSVKPPRHTKERYRTRRSTRMWFYALPVMP